MNIILFSIISFLLVCTISIVVCHYSIKMSRYNVRNNKIPNNFDGFKVIHLSDLHSRVFSKDNIGFVDTIVKEKPDIIVMTGDMINGNYSDILGLKKLIQSINEKSQMFALYTT